MRRERPACRGALRLLSGEFSHYLDDSPRMPSRRRTMTESARPGIEDGGDPTPPGAVRPWRRRTVVRHGVRIAVYEWGDAEAPPLLLAHGGFDFARTFDVFAPLLAAGGWRVVSLGPARPRRLRARGALQLGRRRARRARRARLDDARACAVVGHSKGGSLLTHLAEACPHRVSRLVNIDGLPSRAPSSRRRRARAHAAARGRDSRAGSTIAAASRRSSASRARWTSSPRGAGA